MNLSIYEQRLHRSMKDALRRLKELQAERRERRRAELDDAIRLRKAQQMQGLPFDSADAAQASVRCAVDGHGFVYSIAEIDSKSARRDRLRDSILAEQARFNLTQYTAFFEVHSQPATSHQ